MEARRALTGPWGLNVVRWLHIHTMRETGVAGEVSMGKQVTKGFLNTEHDFAVGGPGFCHFLEFDLNGVDVCYWVSGSRTLVRAGWVLPRTGPSSLHVPPHSCKETKEAGNSIFTLEARRLRLAQQGNVETPSVRIWSGTREVRNRLLPLLLKCNNYIIVTPWLFLCYPFCSLPDYWRLHERPINVFTSTCVYPW